MDKILEAIQAATLAPSSGNIQNWQFIVVTNTDLIRQMYHYTLDQEPFLTAPAAVIVCGDVEYAHTLYGVRGKRLYTTQNCAAAIQNFLLAAEALEFSTTWIGAFDEDKITAMFDIPGRSRAQAIILVGYPEKLEEWKDRKPLESMVFFNEFGLRVLRPNLIYFDWVTEWRNQSKKIRAHVSHLTKKISRDDNSRHSDQQTPVPSRSAVAQERLRTSFESASSRMRSVIDSLKREEYQKSEKKKR